MAEFVTCSGCGKQAFAGLPDCPHCKGDLGNARALPILPRRRGKGWGALFSPGSIGIAFGIGIGVLAIIFD